MSGRRARGRHVADELQGDRAQPGGDRFRSCARRQAAHGCAEIRGWYVPTAKNGLIRELFRRLGFEQVGRSEEATEWAYDLTVKPPVTNPFIDVAREEEPIGAGV